MAFPNLLKRLFASNGAGITLRGDIMPYGTAAPKAHGTAAAGSAETLSRSDHVHPLQTTVSGNAGSATKLATKRTIDGVSFDGSANIHHYGTCSTAADTAAKTVALANFVLATGAIAFIRFTVTNTASSPTLNINSTGAKAIRYRNETISAGHLAANRTYCFIYDGSYYQLVGDIDTNTTYTAASATPKAPGTAAVGTSTKYAREDHVHPLQTTVSGSSGSCSGNSATATKLAAKRTIDGVNFDGSANIHHYGTCSTAADTAAKTVTLANFVLATGAIVFVRFTVTNTASSPTLNINSTGAKAIRYRNATISAGYLAANRTYCFIYDGSYYQLVGDIDTNTTYTAASATPKAPGTAAVGTSTKYAREDHVHPAQEVSAFPAGTQMLFVQASAPTGWTKQTTVNDAAIRVVSGTTGGGTGGNVAFSTVFMSDKAVTLSGNVGATTISSGQSPSHSHSFLLFDNRLGNYTALRNTDGAATSLQKVTNSWNSMPFPVSNNSGGNSSHTHSLSGTATVDLSVKYLDTILCKKA